jgi:hypothetical protein
MKSQSAENRQAHARSGAKAAPIHKKDAPVSESVKAFILHTEKWKKKLRGSEPCTPKEDYKSTS